MLTIASPRRLIRQLVPAGWQDRHLPPGPRPPVLPAGRPRRLGEYALRGRSDRGGVLAGDEAALHGFLELVLVEQLGLMAERYPDVEQLVLIVEAELRPLLRTLEVHVPPAEAAVVVGEQEDGERIVTMRDAELSAVQDTLLIRPVAEQVVADRVRALWRKPQDGAAVVVLDDERRSGVPDAAAKNLT
jgi:hypothetical protein